MMLQDNVILNLPSLYQFLVVSHIFNSSLFLSRSLRATKVASHSKVEEGALMKPCPPSFDSETSPTKFFGLKMNWKWNKRNFEARLIFNETGQKKTEPEKSLDAEQQLTIETFDAHLGPIHYLVAKTFLVWIHT